MERISWWYYQGTPSFPVSDVTGFSSFPISFSLLSVKCWFITSTYFRRVSVFGIGSSFSVSESPHFSLSSQKPPRCSSRTRLVMSHEDSRTRLIFLPSTHSGSHQSSPSKFRRKYLLPLVPRRFRWNTYDLYKTTRWGLWLFSCSLRLLIIPRFGTCW